MARKFYNLVLKAQNNPEARIVIEQLYNSVNEKVNNLIEQDDVHQSEQQALPRATTSTTTVLNPNKANTKGRSKRTRGHFEKKKSNTIQRQEFGTKTSNQ